MYVGFRVPPASFSKYVVNTALYKWTMPLTLEAPSHCCSNIPHCNGRLTRAGKEKPKTLTFVNDVAKLLDFCQVATDTIQAIVFQTCVQKNGSSQCTLDWIGYLFCSSAVHGQFGLLMRDGQFGLLSLGAAIIIIIMMKT